MYTVRLAFKLLCDAVKVTNKSSKEFVMKEKNKDIFEPSEKAVSMGDYEQFLARYPVVGE